MKKGEKPSVPQAKTTRAQDRKLVAIWARAGKELERIRCEELRTFDYTQHLKEIDTLLELGFQFRRPRTTSGLVQLQQALRAGHV